ncbi:geranylgeranyl diphosphate synthase type I [Nonomuraea muscovyensis]|uniref:Geranylgeranyl diphosphate synthase type I n=1 Tax=Nonomuraea muscovyensis TaxID=1124761 RepID=A0A7X0C5D9_9ACTN|nr:polyprenyl synthetase family protein [Nonomuraea muscovyensis]MBB6348835.1 geranylgeranyl diphosphate synthase type I [Nonomuraea muscovyensis]
MRRLLEPALRDAVASLHPWGGDMAAFSLGWTEADGTPAGERGGKALRPALAVLCAEAVGGAPEQAVPGALAVELVHAFSLVHDDIIDHDEQRRHRDSVWKAFGVGPAVLTGDALLALAISRLAETGNGPAMARLSAALVELVNGQTEDMAFEDRPWTGRAAVTLDEYCAMAARKTGALLGCAAAVGVTLGGGTAAQADQVYQVGLDLGVAFQIADDLLGIWGDPNVTGKPVHSDLRRGKKTLPVLAALAAGGPAAGDLTDLLVSGATGSTDDEPARRAARLVEQAGGRAFAVELADRRVATAMAALDACLPSATTLRALCLTLVNRTR